MLKVLTGFDSVNNDIAGWCFIILIIILTFYLSKRWSNISKILWTALILRLSLLLYGYYFAILPDSSGDALGFELLALEWSKEGFLSVLEKFRGTHTYFISWIIAVLYSLTGRSILMAHSISLLVGVSTIYIGCSLIRKLWGENIAIKGGWVLSLFPTLILYSALILREVYVVFFFIIALHGVVNWSRTLEIKSLLLALTGFILATFFHGAMIIGGVVFLIIVFFQSFKKLINSLIIRNSINIKHMVLFTSITTAFFLIVSTDVSVPKLGSFSNAINIEKLIEKIEELTTGSDGAVGASYPKIATPSSVNELFYKGPIRIAYFVFSPFPWDIRKTSQIIGLLDSFCYVSLVILTLCNIKTIWNDPASRNILLLLISYIIVFGLLVGNYGVAIRHRSKFVFALILLASPLLPKIILRQRKIK